MALTLANFLWHKWDGIFRGQCCPLPKKPSICLTDSQKGEQFYGLATKSKKLFFTRSMAVEALYIYQNPPQSLDCVMRKEPSQGLQR